jgi:curved DNA-binding protein CbpA
MAETYYEVLGVDPDATRDEIESAYRDRVLETHPDHSDDPDASERFQRVTTAKAVLTDGTERARYDRLGHDSYVELAQGTGADRSGSETERTDAEGPASSGAASTGSATAGGRTGANDRRTDGADAASGSGDRTRARAGGGSRRRERRAHRNATDGWSFDGDRTHTEGTESRARQTATTERGTDAEADDFRYSVHDWDGEVELGADGSPIDHATAVTAASVALLYPLLVAATLTPAFPTAVNAVVAACTLALIGYLLTLPRIAMAAFGVWSLVFPVGIAWLPSIDPVSVRGLLALAFAWVPFGYAVTLRWTLRP